MKILTKVLVVVVASGILLTGYFYRDLWMSSGVASSNEAETSAPVVPAAVDPSGVVAGQVPRSRDAGRDEQGSPAWMGAAGDTGRVASASAPPKENAQRSARLQASLRQLEKLQRQGNPDPAAVEAALADVEKAHGSTVLQGVRLDVLRENLKVAARMQKAAAELQLLQQRNASGERSTAQQAELQQKLAEIQAMQSELRMDFMVDGNKPARP